MADGLGVLGVAVAGLGVGEQHARAYAASPRCSLRWLYDLDRARAEQLGDELGVEVAGSFEELLEDPSVDLISIASYDDAHAGQVMAALSADKHVFVEKPLCRSVAELRAVRSAWTHTQNCHLRSNFVLRAAPLYTWLRSFIAERRLGVIYAFDGDYLYGRLRKITAATAVEETLSQVPVPMARAVKNVALLVEQICDTASKEDASHQLGSPCHGL